MIHLIVFLLLISLKTLEQYLKHTENIVKVQNQNIERQKKEIDKVVRELLGKNQRDTLVSCFTEKKDSILMWSYYTENHKGFCIEYDTAKAEIFHQQVLPVIYDDNRYNAIRLLETQNNNIILNPYVYKAKCWKHEKEWRILSTHCEEIHPNDNVYLKEAITGVYLGAKIDKDIEEEIKNWEKQKKYPFIKWS